MKKLHVKHWQDPVIALLGAWLAVSPWVLGFQHLSGAVAACLAFGLALLATGLGAMLAPHRWEHWTACALGAGAAVSPWLLGFANELPAAHHTLAAGIVASLLALWVLARESDLGSWNRDLLAH